MFTFDVKNKYLKVDPEAVGADGVLEIDAVENVYKECRVWEASVDGIVFDEVVKAKGGVVLPTGLRTPVRVILLGGWRIQCPDGTTTVMLYGSLYTDDNQDPFAPKPDGGKVVVREVTRREVRRRNYLFFGVVATFAIALLIFVIWAITGCDELEPYAGMFLVLAALLQLFRDGGSAKN